MSEDYNISTESKFELEQILKQTEKLDFPFCASYDEKQSILENTKHQLIEQIKAVFEKDNLFFDDSFYESVWENSVEQVEPKFENLGPKLMLNGFYLQEVFHTFVEQIIGEVS